MVSPSVSLRFPTTLDIQRCRYTLMVKCNLATVSAWRVSGTRGDVVSQGCQCCGGDDQDEWKIVSSQPASPRFERELKVTRRRVPDALGALSAHPLHVLQLHAQFISVEMVPHGCCTKRCPPLVATVKTKRTIQFVNWSPTLNPTCVSTSRFAAFERCLVRRLPCAWRTITQRCFVLCLCSR